MITISGNSLQEVEQQLVELKRQLARQAHDHQPPPDAALRRKTVELKRRATKTTGLVWKLVKAVAARQGPCTLEELAHDLGLPHAASVHSLIAVLGRPCKRLEITVIVNLGGNPTRYTMPDDVRAIVLSLG